MVKAPQPGQWVVAKSLRGHPIGLVLRYSSNGRDVRLELRGLSQRLWVRSNTIELCKNHEQMALPLPGCGGKDGEA